MAKLYSEMAPAERALIDAQEDRRERYKSNLIGADMSMMDIMRGQYASLRKQAKEAGFRGSFQVACLATRRVDMRDPKPEQWVAAAERVLSDLRNADNLCNDDYEGP